MRDRLDYIFYRFYRFQSTMGNGLIAGPAGMMFLSLLWIIHFFSIVNFLYGAIGINISSEILFICYLSAFFCVLAVNYFLFIYGKRYREIVKKYEKENKQQRKKGNLMVMGYFFLTFLLLGISLYFMIRRNDG